MQYLCVYVLTAINCTSKAASSKKASYVTVIDFGYVLPKAVFSKSCFFQDSLKTQDFSRFKNSRFSKLSVFKSKIFRIFSEFFFLDFSCVSSSPILSKFLSWTISSTILVSWNPLSFLFLGLILP